MRKSLLILCVAASLALAACASKPKPHEAPPAETAGNSGADAAGANSSSANGGADEGAAAQGPMGGSLAQRIIYFDFDSSEIRSDATELVAAHAKYLSHNPTVKVRLEGHTDERGSREYNIGLGERRAQAVRRALMLQGATDQQISTVSYGAERPAVLGSSEDAWSKNRRVEIVYLK